MSLGKLWLKIEEYVQCAPEEKEHVRQLLVAFPQALKEHLRGNNTDSFVEALKLSKSDHTHVPMQITRQLFASLSKWESSGNVDGYKLLLIDQHAPSLA